MNVGEDRVKGCTLELSKVEWHGGKPTGDEQEKQSGESGDDETSP